MGKQTSKFLTCWTLDWKPEVQFHELFIVSYSHSFRELNLLFQSPYLTPAYKLARDSRAADLVSSLQCKHFLLNILSITEKQGADWGESELWYL